MAPRLTLDGVAKPRTFGEYIRRIREGRGLTLKQVTKDLGFSENALSGIENSANPGVRMDTLVKVGNYYGLDYNEVMTYFGAKGPQGLERVASEIATRPELRALHAVAREMDAPAIRQLIRIARVTAVADEEAL